MVVVGADVHKRSHTFVAVDELGKLLDQLTVGADGKGHAKALRWARQMFPGDRTWGIEDCRHLSARLERDLLTGGERGGAGAAEADGAGSGVGADPRQV